MEVEALARQNPWWTEKEGKEKNVLPASLFLSLI
jgi:hypothetical protein